MVFVLDKKKEPLMPCSEKRARLLLERGRAAVHKMSPFTIRLKDRLVDDSSFQILWLKLDPGAKETGVAVIRKKVEDNEDYGVYLGEIHHKTGISSSLKSRRELRRGRRNRKTRHRAKRFDYRRRPEGWIPPSRTAHVSQTMSAVNKMMRLLPIAAIGTEDVKFDTQLLNNPDIAGVEYQQGELWGYEVKEYLLEKYGRTCQYCKGKKNDPVLEVEHMTPISQGGSSRIENLTLACRTCNQEKGNMTAEEYGFPEVREKIHTHLKNAAKLNTTRKKLLEKLQILGIPVESGTGARTKMQRTEHELPKTHYFDACCVGVSTQKKLYVISEYVDIWKALGRGTRKMCNVNQYGFPISHRSRKKNHFGFQTGDLVKAVIPKGKYAGTWKGRVSCRATGYFDIKDSVGKRVCQGISHKHMKVLQRMSGWQHEKTTKVAHSSPCLKAGASCVRSGDTGSASLKGLLAKR